MGGFVDLCSLISDIIVGFKEETDKPKLQANTDKPIILTAAKLRELRWLDVRQIAAVYNYGKVKVRIEDSDSAYRELRWLTPAQINAIFGTDEDDAGT